MELTKKFDELIGSCGTYLDEILKISEQISDAAKKDKFDEIESLFSLRGQEIQKLFDCESELSEVFKKIPDDVQHNIIIAYKDKRQDLFENIQRIDSHIKKLLLELKHDILSEMKQLNRGKKMRHGYFSDNKLNKGFIDIKE